MKSSSSGGIANFSEVGLTNRHWWPDLTWPGNFFAQWILVQIHQVWAFSVAAFSNGTIKTWGGGAAKSPPPPPPTRNRVDGMRWKRRAEEVTCTYWSTSIPHLNLSDFAQPIKMCESNNLLSGDAPALPIRVAVSFSERRLCCQVREFGKSNRAKIWTQIVAQAHFFGRFVPPCRIP